MPKSSSRSVGGEEPSLEATFPVWADYYVGVVRALRDLGGSGTVRQIEDAVARSLDLSPALLAIPYRQDSRTKFQYELAWTRTKLRIAGLIENPARGAWSLTDLGRASSDESVARLAMSKAEPLPEPPVQGKGPKFVLEHGEIAFAGARKATADETGSVAPILPVLRETVGNFQQGLEAERGLWPFLDKAVDHYAQSIRAEVIDFGRLFGEGIVLKHAIAAARATDDSGNAFPLTPSLATLADSVLEMHAALVMASKEGRDLAESTRVFNELDNRSARSRAQADFVEAILSPTAPVKEEVREHLIEIKDADDKDGSQHVKSYLGAFVRNTAVVLAAGAAATVAVLTIPNLVVAAIGGYLANLVGSEALKKSKAGKAAAEALAKLVDWATVDFVARNARTIRNLAEDPKLAEVLGWLERNTPSDANAPTPRPPPGKRVLLVEPSPQKAEIFQSDLAKTSHTLVAVVRDADEARRAYDRADVDVIVTETILADGTSGIALANELIKLRPLPVIFLTSYPERLLTKDRPEPTWLFTQPYRASDVMQAISTASASRPYDS